MLMSAENLPYYQGMILFFLAMSFPFFAMLLLVPGKHAGFLMWFLFWLWAKSWDVGFALVMQLDDILFSIFGMHQLYNTQGRNMEITQDLATTIWAIRELDPSFNLSTYYNIMAVCLMSIPVVTSQLILGGLTGGAGLVSSGMNLSIGEFARGAQTAQAQAAISNLKYELNDYKMEAARGTQQHWGGMPIVRANASGGEIGANYSSRSGRTVPQPVGMPNRSPIGSKSGVITPAAQPYTLGDLSQRMEGLQRLARVKGMASGAADPRGVDLLPDVKGFWERMGFGRARMEQVIKAASAISTTAGKGIERIYAQKLKNEIAALEADIDVMTSYAVNDAIYSERGKKLAFMIRLYGGIEVPINAETPPMLAEADREIKMRRMELDSYATFLDLLADGMGGVGKLGTALSKHRNMGEAYDAMLAKGSGMNPGAINWASGDWTKALPRGAPVGEFQTLLMQRLAPPGVATWTILDLPGFRGPGREPEMPKEHPGVGFGGEAPLSYRLRDEDGGGIRGIPATALAFADDVRRRAVDDDDGPGFAFTGFGRGAGTDELGWMRTEAWLNSSSGGGGGSTVAINYVSDSGGGGSDFGGGGDYVAMEVGSFFTASRFRPSIGDDAFGDFGASRQDSSWAFAPVGAGGSHEPNSSHFAPVNLDGHGSGGGVGHGGPEKLVANIGFGELPLDLSPEEREEIERNPNAAQEIIQRRRGGNKGGGSTIV